MRYVSLALVTMVLLCSCPLSTGAANPKDISALVERLDRKPDIGILRDISDLGENAKSAGPRVVRLLRDDDWDLRVGAARTLGRIGYAEAVPELVKLLDTDHDWRLVYVSVVSLAMLRATNAVPALTEVSTGHWDPVVRKAAKDAILSISQGTSPYSKHGQAGSRFEFFDFELNYTGELCHRCTKNKDNAIPSNAGEVDALNRKQLKRLVYKFDINSFVDAAEREKDDSVVKQIPNVGIRVKGGYLVGSSRGEWGGELMFIDSRGTMSALLHKNVVNIHRLNTEIVVVTGLLHMGMNRGLLYKVSRLPDGQWKAVKWRVLPGAPCGSFLRGNGNLGIECGRGAVEVSPDGKMRMIEPAGDQG